jgi:transcriptional regulator with XRE-family HTH domain
MITFGEKIKILRSRKKYSQQDLADKTGISRPYVGKMESGECNPTSDVLKSLAREFGVTVDYLVFDEQELSPTNVFIQDKELLKQVELLDKISSDKLEAIKKVIDCILYAEKIESITKNKDKHRKTTDDNKLNEEKQSIAV